LGLLYCNGNNFAYSYLNCKCFYMQEISCMPFHLKDVKALYLLQYYYQSYSITNETFIISEIASFIN